MSANNDHVGSTPATPVELKDKTIQELTAENVSITNGGAGAVKGQQVSVTLTNGGIGAVMAQKAEIKVKDGAIGAAMAQELTANDTSIAVAFAGNISGNARIMVDMRAGLVAGLSIGVVLAALKLLTRSRK